MARRRRAGGGRWPPGNARLRALVEEAIVDAYNESEERTAFYTMLDEHLDVPFETKLLSATATVERIDMTNDDQIVAICRRGRSRQAIPILDLLLPSPPPAVRSGSRGIKLPRNSGFSWMYDASLAFGSHRWNQVGLPAEGFEPPTNGLQNRCSTTELSRRAFGRTAIVAQAVSPAEWCGRRRWWSGPAGRGGGSVA